MTVTTETINSLSDKDLKKMSLGEKWKIAVQLSTGIGVRTGKRFFKTPALVTMVATGVRNNTEIHSYLEQVTTKIIQTYRNNNDISKNELLRLENLTKESALVDVI